MQIDLFWTVIFLAQQPQVGHGLLILEFLDHIQRRTTVCRSPLDEWSARSRDLYLTKHNTHKRQTSMPPVVFEPTFPTSERPQTYALDRSATGTCFWTVLQIFKHVSYAYK